MSSLVECRRPPAPLRMGLFSIFVLQAHSAALVTIRTSDVSVLCTEFVGDLHQPRLRWSESRLPSILTRSIWSSASRLRSSIFGVDLVVLKRHDTIDRQRLAVDAIIVIGAGAEPGEQSVVGSGPLSSPPTLTGSSATSTDRW